MSIITFHDNFRRRIGSLQEGGFTDAILSVEGVKIPVHKCILAVQSEYFSHLFSRKKGSRETADRRGDVSNSQAIVELERDHVSNSNHQSICEINDVTTTFADNVFKLRNTKVEVVRAVLDYFYRGEYNYNNNVETHMLALELAHQFKLRDLEETLRDNLVKSITVENFIGFYNMKMRSENDQLESSCLSFLKENGEEIAKIDNFSKLTLDSLLSILDEDNFAAAEIDIFRAAERWAGMNKPNKKTVKDIVEKIRLATISQKDLFDVVKRSRELPSIDILEAIQSITNKDAASTNFRQQPTLVADLNVAQSSLGAKLLDGTIFRHSLISGSSGCTSHKAGGRIVVKLGKTYRLNALQLLLDSSEGRSYKYHVEVSVDEKEWVRVVDHSNYWCRSHQFLKFDPRAVRFIRMTGTDEALKIVSLKAMYTNKECALVQGIPVASNNVILVSRGATFTGYCDNFYKPMHCIDGREDSRAAVFQDFPFTIKLGQPHWLSSLRVKLDAWGTSYTIESSPDGESWQPVGGEGNGEDGRVWRTFKFSRRVVLHFRVTITELKPNHVLGLYHCESPASTNTVTN